MPLFLVFLGTCILVQSILYSIVARQLLSLIVLCMCNASSSIRMAKKFCRKKLHQTKLYVPLYCKNISQNIFLPNQYVIINTGEKKKSRIKISPIRASDKIGRNFLLVKISSIVHPLHANEQIYPSLIFS